MSTVYAPLQKAINSVASYVIPGRYRVKFFVSQDEVKPGYDGVGTLIQTTGSLAHLDGTFTPAKVYEEFLVPVDREDVAVFENRQTKKGETYVDPKYTKFENLQGVTKTDIESLDDVLTMLETAKVVWRCNLQIYASSKDKDKNPVSNWAEIQEFFETYGGEKVNTWEKDGTTNLSLTLYSDKPEDLAIIEAASMVPGLRFRNMLNNKKPTLVR